MTDQPSRNRRIVKRVVWTLVLLPVLYLSSFVSFHFAWGVGIVPPPVIEPLRVGVYAPFEWYISRKYPGSRAILALRNMAGDAGAKVGSHIPK